MATQSPRPDGGPLSAALRPSREPRPRPRSPAPGAAPGQPLVSAGLPGQWAVAKAGTAAGLPAPGRPSRGPTPAPHLPAQLSAAPRPLQPLLPAPGARGSPYWWLGPPGEEASGSGRWPSASRAGAGTELPVRPQMRGKWETRLGLSLRPSVPPAPHFLPASTSHGVRQGIAYSWAGSQDWIHRVHSAARR